MFDLNKNNAVGEVLESSLDKISVGLWPNKKISFGSIMIFEEFDESGFPNHVVGICYDLFHKSLESDRVPRILQMNQLEIAKNYPHFSTYLIYWVDVILFGALRIDSHQQPTFFSNYKSVTQPLHSWSWILSISDCKNYFDTSIILQSIYEFDIPDKTKRELAAKILFNLFLENSINLDEKRMIFEKVFIPLERIFGLETEKFFDLYGKLEKLVF